MVFKMNKLKNNKSVIAILVIICALQIMVSVFWGNQKNSLFFDEVFSYPAANCASGEFSKMPENRWLDEHWYTDFMSVNQMHTFEYSIPYGNQISDVHPPLFYLLLHTACSFIPGEFSIWTGIGLNVMFFVGCTLVLFFLGKELFESNACGLLAAFLYAVSYGGINTMVYIRMYMLVTFMALIHALTYVKYFERERIPARAYVFLALTMLGGVMSQYYFLFIAFFFGVWYTIKFFKEKRWADLGKYLGTIGITAAVSLSVWPAMLEHLFGNGRGEEARGNLLSMNGYLSDLREMFRIMNNDMFTKLLPAILVAMLFLWLICYKKKISILLKARNTQFAILFVCVGYFLLVTKAAPYQTDRYVMMIYPLVYLLVIGNMYLILSKFVSERLASGACILVFLGLSIVHMLHSGIPYTYVKNQDTIERNAIAEDYHENYAIYVSDNKGAHFYDAIQMLKEYKGYYYIYDLTRVEQIQQDMKVLENEKNLVVYVKNKRTTEETNELIQEVFNGQRLGEDNLLDQDEKWSVYLIKL